MKFHLSIPTISSLEHPCLCLWAWKISLMFSLAVSEFQVFDPFLIDVFTEQEMWLKFPSSACWSLIFSPPLVEKAFLRCMFLAPMSASDDGCSVGWLLGPSCACLWGQYYLFCYFVFWNIIEEQKLWCLQHCSFCFWLLWLFEVLMFPCEFQDYFSVSVKKGIEILMGITLNL